MVTEYTIYLVNNSASTQQFWCFLAKPQELASDSSVFANSSTTLAVAPASQGINTFTIPVQYVVGAGASNKAVGLATRITSSITQNTDLGKGWDAGYATVPPNLGPTLKPNKLTVGSKQLAIKANEFHQANNEANGWFSNMSYGIKTNQGFIGMTWSPSPGMTRTITPTLKFYVAVGSFGSNELASWTDVSNKSAEVAVPTDFALNKVTVTYTETGGWEITPGAPDLSLSFAPRRFSVPNMLLHSHQQLVEAHAQLVRGNPGRQVDHESAPRVPGLLGGGDSQRDEVVDVEWHHSRLAANAEFTFLSGSITVATALTAAFSVFVLSGVYFSITSTSTDGTSVDFTYSGEKSVEAIKSLLVAGAELLFKK